MTSAGASAVGRSLPSVSVVVPVRNGEATIASCLESLMAGSYPLERREIVVVDNGSRDRTAEIAATFPVRTVFEPRRGRSRARNAGIAHSSGEIVAFIDADCVADADWLPRLVAGFAGDAVGAVGAVAGEVLPHDPTTATERFMAQRRPRWQHRATHQPRPYAITSNVAFPRATFEQVGLFDPEFDTHEDVDFGWRLTSAGLGLRYEARAVIYHRLRADPIALFCQQFGFGYGRAVLIDRYGLPPGFELPSLRTLGGAVGDVLRSVRRADGAVAFSSHELLLLTALRGGALLRRSEMWVRGAAGPRNVGEKSPRSRLASTWTGGD